MGRRRSNSGDRVPARPDPAAPLSAKLQGWPPYFYCYACHARSFSAEEIREGYCEQCHAFLAELELAYRRALSAARAKKVPEA